jgi:hypothetical protein
MSYRHFLILLGTVMLFAGGLPRSSAAADPILVLEHWTNYR